MKKTIRVICMATMMWMAWGNAFGQVSFVENDGKVSMVNNEGKTVVEFQKDEDSWVLDDFEDGWGRIRVNGKIGLADANGWIVEPQDGKLGLYDGFYSVETFDSEKIISSLSAWNREGECLLEQTENVYGWLFGSDKVMPVKYKGKFGIMDKTGWVAEPTYGTMVIEPRYRAVGVFSEGLVAFVGDENLWGYMDKTGKVVIKPQFDAANPFDESGKALVRIGDDETGTMEYVDKNGNFMLVEE